MKDKHKKFKNRGNAGNWIGVGTAIGAADLSPQMNQRG